MCHVLTVFTFTKSVCTRNASLLKHSRNFQAKYAYRSIAEFIKHATSNSPEHLALNPFPELHRPPSEVSTDDEPETPQKPSLFFFSASSLRRKPKSEISSRKDDDAPDVKLYKQAVEVTSEAVKQGHVEGVPSSASIAEKETVCVFYS